MAKTALPAAQQPEVTPDEMTDDINLRVRMMQLPRINHKDTAAIKNRIDEYFQLCADHGRRPGIEGLCLSLGVSRQGLWKWTQEKTEKGELARRAKQLIITLLEGWSLEGRLNPATSCFMLKNWGGYLDTVRIEAATSDSPTPGRTPEEIARIIESDIPIDAEPGTGWISSEK